MYHHAAIQLYINLILLKSMHHTGSYTCRSYCFSMVDKRVETPDIAISICKIFTKNECLIKLTFSWNQEISYAGWNVSLSVAIYKYIHVKCYKSKGQFLVSMTIVFKCV